MKPLKDLWVAAEEYFQRRVRQHQIEIAASKICAAIEVGDFRKIIKLINEIAAYAKAQNWQPAEITHAMGSGIIQSRTIETPFDGPLMTTAIEAITLDRINSHYKNQFAEKLGMNERYEIFDAMLAAGVDVLFFKTKTKSLLHSMASEYPMRSREADGGPEYLELTLEYLVAQHGFEGTQLQLGSHRIEPHNHTMFAALRDSYWMKGGRLVHSQPQEELREFMYKMAGSPWPSNKSMARYYPAKIQEDYDCGAKPERVDLLDISAALRRRFRPKLPGWD